MDQASVPDECLEAIDAARRRLLLTGELEDVVGSYRQLGEEAVSSIQDLSFDRAQAVLADLNELNEQARKIIDRSRGTRFSDSAERCEEIAGVSSPSPSPSP